MDRRKEIAKYGQLIHEKGLVIGAGGNISARDGDFLIIKRKSADMSEGNAGDYVRIPFEEAEKETELLSSEAPLHIACYKAAQNVGALVHVHSPFTIAAAGKIDFLASTSYEFDCILEKSVPVVEYIQPGSRDLANTVADKVKEGAGAVMMRKHGAVSVGEDLKEAYLRILALERACVTFLHS
jgi:L-fuculose-phosphate aldolase